MSLESITTTARNNLYTVYEEGLRQVIAAASASTSLVDTRKQLAECEASIADLRKQLESERARFGKVNDELQTIRATLTEQEARHKALVDAMKNTTNAERQRADEFAVRIKILDAELKTQRETSTSLDVVKMRTEEVKRELQTQHTADIVRLKTEHAVEIATLSDEFEKSKPKRLSSAEQGNAGELEVETYLRATFGKFMTVENVSKSAAKHQMDLALTTDDGRVHIRIDVKNIFGDRLRKDDYDRFYVDMDALKPQPDAAILFSRSPLRAITKPDVDQKVEQISQRGKRGNALVYWISRWQGDALVHAIHDIIVQKAVERNEQTQAQVKLAKPITGSDESFTLNYGLSNLVQKQSKYIAGIAATSKEICIDIASESVKMVAAMQAVHAINPRAMPKQTLVEFEKHALPPAKGGRQPKHKIPNNTGGVENKNKKQRS